VTEQAFRRHHDERASIGAQHLPPQQMEDLRRRAGDADLDVLLGA